MNFFYYKSKFKIKNNFFCGTSGGGLGGVRGDGGRGRLMDR